MNNQNVYEPKLPFLFQEKTYQNWQNNIWLLIPTNDSAHDLHDIIIEKPRLLVWRFMENFIDNDGMKLLSARQIHIRIYTSENNIHTELRDEIDRLIETIMPQILQIFRLKNNTDFNSWQHFFCKDICTT